MRRRGGREERGGGRRQPGRPRRRPRQAPHARAREGRRVPEGTM